MALLEHAAPTRSARPSVPGPGLEASRPAMAPGAQLLPWASAVVLFAVYTVLSVERHIQHLTSGYDLGIFEQEVASYAHGHLPTSALKGPGYQLLGDHFSPIFATLAPFYRLFPTPMTLLVAQAALLAVAAVPLVGWAQRTVSRGAGLAVAFGYGLSWGIAQTVGFDVHEVAFAVPLLAFAAAALGQDRLRAAVLWAAPLVLVKEDLGLTVAVLGLLVAFRGARRLGAVTAAGGVLATAVATYVVIPAFNPAGNTYTGQLSDSGGPLHTLLNVLSPDTKIATLALVLAPTAFLAVRSPLLWLAAPTLLWRFLADNPAYWGTGYHYSAVLMPIVFAAFVDGLQNRPEGQARRWLTASALVTAFLIPTNPFASLASSTFWHRDPQVAEVDDLLARIPAGVNVSASNWLAPQLTARDNVSLFGQTPIDVAHPDYIVVDTGEHLTFPITSDQQETLLAQAEADGYRVVGQSGSVKLLHRG